MLQSPFEIDKLTNNDIENEFYRLKGLYCVNAVSPFQWADNIEILAQIKSFFSIIQSRKEEEYAMKKLEVEFKEAEILNNSRSNWDESKGKAPNIDYFKSQAKVECKLLWQEVFKLKKEAQQFKSVCETYDDRIAAIKYKINAMKIEGGING